MLVALFRKFSLLVPMRNPSESFSGRGNMTTISMIPLGKIMTLNRPVLLTVRRMSGAGGDDFICGHCGSIMLKDFDPSTVTGNPIYRCGSCENNNDLPFPPSEIATGLHRDPD